MSAKHAPIMAAPLLAVALLAGACGSPTPGPGRQMTFPQPSAGTPTTASTVLPPPGSVPPARDPVAGQGTVLQVRGGAPQLCLGPVRESFPPQCQGVPLAGWSWAQNPPDHTVTSDGSLTRWGQYVVSGGFDGRTVTVRQAVPLGLDDTVAQPSPRPMAPPDLSARQWADVEAGVRLLPGLLTSSREGDTGPLHATVVHDDGTLQDGADASFGSGTVVVTSALR